MFVNTKSILQANIGMIFNSLLILSFPNGKQIDASVKSAFNRIQTIDFDIKTEIRLLLRYMDTTNDDSDDRNVIQLKSCPRCKTAIRRSLRYGNVIKQQLLDIERVKKKVRGDSDEVMNAKERLETRLTSLKGTFNGEGEMKDWEKLERGLRRMSKGSKTSAVVTENQVTLMERFCALSQKLRDNLFGVSRSQVSIQSRLEGTFNVCIFSACAFIINSVLPFSSTLSRTFLTSPQSATSLIT